MLSGVLLPACCATAAAVVVLCIVSLPALAVAASAHAPADSDAGSAADLNVSLAEGLLLIRLLGSENPRVAPETAAFVVVASNAGIVGSCSGRNLRDSKVGPGM
jgi:hypothetical protein